MAELLNLELESMAHGGEAIARYAGKVIFVAGGIPGERVLAEIVEDRNRFARAVVRQVLGSTPTRPRQTGEGKGEGRVVPGCPYFGDPIRRWKEDASTACGGCQWQHIAYGAQLAFKRDILRDQLARLGKLPDVLVRPTIGMAPPHPPPPSPTGRGGAEGGGEGGWHYRNHLQLHLTSDGRPGFLGVDNATVVPVETCPIADPILLDLLSSLEIDLPGLERISLRAGINTADPMIVLETRGDEPPEIEVDLSASVVLLLGDGTAVTLVGRPYYVEELAGREFIVSAGSFFQVNTAMAEKLVEVVTRHLDPQSDDVVLDAYCGVGTFGLLLADRVAEVIGIEENPDAVADFDANADDLDNVTLIEGPVEGVLAELDEPIDLAVLDPPRAGCAPQALNELVRLGPRRIAYVSCDPASLARDARRLTDLGYRLVEIQPVDLFPQTYHIEAVGLFVNTGTFHV
jgi:23S rRNA (uracil1939-C5)-methyltransferase